MRAVSHGNGPEMAVSLTDKLTPTHHPHRTRDDQGGAARESGTPRGHGESARHLAQRPLPETPAARRVISAGVVRLGLRFGIAQLQDACFEASASIDDHSTRCEPPRSEWSAAALRGSGSRPFAATRPAPPPLRNQHAALSMRLIVLGHAGPAVQKKRHDRRRRIQARNISKT